MTFTLKILNDISHILYTYIYIRPYRLPAVVGVSGTQETSVNAAQQGGCRYRHHIENVIKSRFCVSGREIESMVVTM